MGLDDRQDEIFPPRRRLEEVRYEAAARRAKRERAPKIAGTIAAVCFGIIMIASVLAVVSALVGGAVWILTGKPIFGG